MVSFFSFAGYYCGGDNNSIALRDQAVSDKG